MNKKMMTFKSLLLNETKCLSHFFLLERFSKTLGKFDFFYFSHFFQSFYVGCSNCIVSKLVVVATEIPASSDLHFVRSVTNINRMRCNVCSINPAVWINFRCKHFTVVQFQKSFSFWF